MTKESAEQQVNPFEQAQFDFKQRLYAEEIPDLNPATISLQIDEIRVLYRQTHTEKDYIVLYSTLSGLAGEALEVAKIRGVDNDTLEGLKELKYEYATITDAFLARAPRDYFDVKGDMSQAKGGTTVAEEEGEKEEEEGYEIDQLELDSQTRGYLVRAGVHTIDALKEKLETGEKISGIGEKRSEVIEEALANLEEESGSEEEDSPQQSS